MVGRNGLFSGYKSQRTKGHKGGGKRKNPKTETKKTEGESQGKKGRTEVGTAERKTGGTGGITRGKEPQKPEELLNFFSQNPRNRKLAFPHPKGLALPEKK